MSSGIYKRLTIPYTSQKQHTGPVGQRGCGAESGGHYFGVGVCLSTGTASSKQEDVRIESWKPRQ